MSTLEWSINYYSHVTKDFWLNSASVSWVWLYESKASGEFKLVVTNVTTVFLGANKDDELLKI